MKFFLAATLLFVAVNAETKLLRGKVNDQFTCEKSGAGGKTQCDAATGDDGTACVWCSVSSFGACVSQSQAEIMEKTIPSLVCDGDEANDDNKKDDDSNSSDDDNTDDYWKCLNGSGETEKTCESAGCTWCVSISCLLRQNNVK
jgi:hypothetical protein